MLTPIYVYSNKPDLEAEFPVFAFLAELAHATRQDGSAWTTPTVQQIADATALPMNAVRRQLKELQRRNATTADLRPAP